MKKYIHLTGVIMVAITILTGCKKSVSARDTGALFKNTIWTGGFHYTDRPPQPVSIDFKTDGSFTWHEIAGDYGGSWTVVNDTLTVTFTSGSAFKAGISADNKLTAIQNFILGKAWTMDNAMLSTGTGITLDDTIWSDTGLELTFRTNSKLDFASALAPHISNATYSRSGNILRYKTSGDQLFMVITSSTGISVYYVQIIGGVPATSLFKVVKQ